MALRTLRVGQTLLSQLSQEGVERAIHDDLQLAGRMTMPQEVLRMLDLVA